MKKIPALVLFYALSLPWPCFAFFDRFDALHNTYVDAAFGVAFDATLHWDSNKEAVGHLSLGRVFFTGQEVQAGIEVGIESGASLHLPFSKEVLASLGGVEIEATLKPALDIALGFRSEPFAEIPLFLLFKGGASFRSLEPDRPSVTGSREVSPMILAGIGVRLYEQAALYLSYQWIGGKRPTLSIDEVNETAAVSHIPTRQAVLLGFTYFF